MVALAPIVTNHQTAATTAASIHLHYEGAVVETPLGAFAGRPQLSGVAVLAPEQGLVEWFPDDAQDLLSLAPAVDEAVGAGWRVAVLIPARRMGEGHRALRGHEVTLQPWWGDGERVRFGGPEVP